MLGQIRRQNTYHTTTHFTYKLCLLVHFYLVLGWSFIPNTDTFSLYTFNGDRSKLVIISLTTELVDTANSWVTQQSKHLEVDFERQLRLKSQKRPQTNC